MIVKQEDGNIVVSSFTKDDITYSIQVNQERNEMVSCSCLDHKHSNACCKHMYLVIYRIFTKRM